MPLVFRSQGLRYFFYSNEGSPREPVHIHVRGNGGEAKIWLEPLSIAGSDGFDARSLGRIIRDVEINRALILEAWHEHFGE